MSKNPDGSWKVTSNKVRYGVFTSSGYQPGNVVKDHSVIANRGYMQSPNDWKTPKPMVVLLAPATKASDNFN